MSPHEFAVVLRQIAAKIDNSENPSRQLVVQDIVAVIMDLGKPVPTKQIHEDDSTEPGSGEPALEYQELSQPSWVRPTRSCDHYWLARRGGVCPKCGEEFKPNFGFP